MESSSVNVANVTKSEKKTTCSNDTETEQTNDPEKTYVLIRNDKSVTYGDIAISIGRYVIYDGKRVSPR